MKPAERAAALSTRQRTIRIATPGDPILGPLAQLPGTWQGQGTGWNMIALPFAKTGPTALDYRLLLNQYDETLVFATVDGPVPNRGVDAPKTTQTDQLLIALDYEQGIHQVSVVDRPPSTVTGSIDAAIHHEPGLFLNMTNFVDDGFDIARLGTIPHGDSVLALGSSTAFAGPPTIPSVDGLPIGVPRQVLINGVLQDNPYLEPYTFFHASPFLGNVTFPGFPGFDPTQPHLLLQLALGNPAATIATTTALAFDTTHATGGISNIPFVVKQANATSMRATFWIEEGNDESGPFLQLQYLQVVILDFFDRFDGLPGRILWPHISINTMRKVSDQPQMVADPG